MKTVKFAAVTVICIFATLFTAGCAGSYSPPRIQKRIYEENVNAPKARIYDVAMVALRKAGFRAAFADRDEGRITTRPRTMKLADKDCDCGTDMGKVMASDDRTTMDVAYFVIASDNAFSLRTIIEARYVASDTSTVKMFHCVSRGALEKDMISRIRDMLEEGGGD